MKIMYDHKYRDYERGYPTEYPTELLNEDWADKIHGQTLERLNERGGLCPEEIYTNIHRLPFKELLKLDYHYCKQWLFENIEL